VSLWSAERDRRDEAADRHIVASRDRRRGAFGCERLGVQTLESWSKAICAGQQCIEPATRAREVDGSRDTGRSGEDPACRELVTNPKGGLGETALVEMVGAR
jgi:hypothetical protein